MRRRRREVEGARGTAVAWRTKRECRREGGTVAGPQLRCGREGGDALCNASNIRLGVRLGSRSVRPVFVRVRWRAGGGRWV